MSLKRISSLMKITTQWQFNRSFAVLSGNANFKVANINKAFFRMAQNYSTLPDIATYEEIKNLPKNPNVLLIDVREAAELKETGVVPTSINIPLGQVVEKLSQNFPADEFERLFGRPKPTAEQQIIFMCKVGGRSAKALEMSKGLGYKNGRNYLGSWEDYSQREKDN